MAKHGIGPKHFKFHRYCKLPSCGQLFGTNREWQHFHAPQCQLAWQRLLKKKHADLIVEVAQLKEKIHALERWKRRVEDYIEEVMNDQATASRT